MKQGVIVAGAMLTWAALAQQPAQAASEEVCVRNSTPVVARLQMTHYENSPETRWDSGWQTLAPFARYCRTSRALRAMNITIDVTDITGWKRACNENWRPAYAMNYEVYISGLTSIRCHRTQ